MVTGSENKVTEIFSGDNARESTEAMELVGRMLDGNFDMEKEGEDFKNFGNDTNSDRVEDLNRRLGVTGGSMSTNGVGMEGTVVNKGFDEGNPESLGEEAGLNAKQNVLSNGQVSNGTSENVVGIHVKPGLLIPKRRREECVTENEGEYYVSDLVWGKIRSHPWWPGQICEPSAASEGLMKYFKKDSYLVSYFGGLKLAWNEASKVRPFQMYFSQMEKRSKTEAFCHAVNCASDEFARRVQLGLSCPCLPQVVNDEIESKVAANVGIKKGWSRRDGRDGFSSTVSFLPAEVVQHLKSLAEAPLSRTDRLEFVMIKAQLLAFNQWKHKNEIPFLKELGGLFNHDVHITEHGGGRHSLEVWEGFFPGSNGTDLVPSKMEKSIPRDGSSWKSKYLSGSDKRPLKRERRVSDPMSFSSPTLLNGQKNKMVLSGKKCETIDFQSGDSKVKRRKSLLLSSPHGKTSSQTETYFRDREPIHRALKYGDRSSNQAPARSGEKLATADLRIPTRGYRISHGERTVPAEHRPPNEIYSKLCLAAIDPTKGYDFLSSIVSLLCEFRNSICLGKNKARKHKRHAEKHEEEQTSISGTTDTFGLVGTEDSYWKDIIVQNISEDRVLFEPEIPTNKNASVAEPEAVVGMQASTDNKQERDVILDKETDNPSCLVDEKPKEYSPMALILTFTNLESIPSIINLNEIFSRYGPLNESETEVLSKSKRAKVFFKRRADAETVFNNRGLFGIFGSTLVSYRLKYYRKLAEAPTTSK
ncbi:unnamed protein product [Fraxinus pennsylvanica]|uniref:PWWP domain-containing protein n=1 Tax=Fraxinus pennsylvanica TaxID=56036 RepID=A0AAD2DVJ2_9LAMI|nr:unnamed protein product [Fraxinus pennsylvanica]